MADTAPDGLTLQMLRGVDNMQLGPTTRKVFQTLTPGYQKLKAQEAARQKARAEALRRGGSEATTADDLAEMEQHKRSRMLYPQ